MSGQPKVIKFSSRLSAHPVYIQPRNRPNLAWQIKQKSVHVGYVLLSKRKYVFESYTHIELVPEDLMSLASFCNAVNRQFNKGKKK